MRSKTKRKSPAVVFREAGSSRYSGHRRIQRMLERLEDMEDLRTLESMRKRPLKFRSLDDFLEEYHPGV